MRNNETTRLSRLVAILTQMQSKRLITAPEIANRFNISVRTAYRDIRALEQAGIPIFTEEGKGYSLIEGYRLPPVMFTEAEANALITAEQFIIKNKDASLVSNYREALTKVKAVLQPNTKDKSALLSERLFFFQNYQNDTTSEYLSEIQIALTTFRIIKISYLPLQQNTKTERQIEPLALYHTKENWILIAWCRLRKDYREFRLDRIQDLKLLESTFKPHNFNLREYFETCR